MKAPTTIERVIDLVDPAGNILLNMSYDEAYRRVLSGDAEQVGAIDGQFSIVAREGKRVRLARSIGRPTRYFLAKRAEGPCLIVAERIAQIRETLVKEGLGDQFHPSYTRMVPAHHVLELQLVGCPDPNPELTIRSVLNNQMLYQEGWGVSAIKHSQIYSGGQSRGHVRTFAPAQVCGFRGFSPFALPRVIEVAEGIPFIELTEWQHERLYALKGQIVAAGVRAVTGLQMPVYPKQRFQRGSVSPSKFQELFPAHESTYRAEFLRQFA